MSTALVLPVTVTLLPPPPGSPGLNPVETVWQALRDNSLCQPRSQTMGH